MEQHKSGAVFRFLTSEEFGALSQDEKVDYLRRALESIQNGTPPAATPPANDESR
jgi:hypothetical protein